MAEECLHDKPLWDTEKKKWTKSNCERCVKKGMQKMYQDSNMWRGILIIDEITDDKPMYIKVMKELGWEFYESK